MANTYFRLALSSVLVEPAEPTASAWPTTDSSPVVRYPVPTRMNGLGQPAGVVGRPWCELGRNKIDSTGMAFYTNLFSVVTDEFVSVKAKLYDPRQAAWKIFHGKMWRPVFTESVPGRVYGFQNFRVTLTDLVEIAGWSTEV